MGGFNLQDLMSKAKAQYDTLQKKMQETVVEATTPDSKKINLTFDLKKLR